MRLRSFCLLCTLLPFIGASATSGSVRQSASETALARAAAAAPGPDESRSGALILKSQLVSLTLVVTDSSGRFIPGLSKEHFDVFDDKQLQEIAHFSDADAPVSIGILFDISGSMGGRVVRSLHALSQFIEKSHQEDEFFLVGFNNSARVIHDFNTPVNRLIWALNMVIPDGKTALYDAVYLGVEKVLQGRHAKKALLIISDGQDNCSRYSLDELRRRLHEADVVIYGIGITDPTFDPLSSIGQATLKDLCHLTGGRAFFPNATENELIDICTKIALELRHQYSLGFYPTDAGSTNQFHKVEIKLKQNKGLGRVSLLYKRRYASFNSRAER